MMSTCIRLSFFIIAIGFIAVSALPQTRPNLKKFTTSEERIRSHGYPAESHFVETDDGYVLNLFRIPYSHKLQNQNQIRPAILLQHGLFSNSDCWLSSGPDHSLAYLLADAGYDVWMGNARGNIYSKENTKISVHNMNFWNFDWHEIGTIDIAAMIDYIIEQTGQETIHYAGHSQGTTVYFVLLSERPEYNSKIKSGHMLAPCAFFEHGSSFIFRLFGPLVGTPGGIWNTLLSNTELMPRNDVINRMIDTSCGTNPALGPYCGNMYTWVTGDGYQNTNQSSLQVLIETHPAGSSSNQGIHYIQLSASGSGHFRQMDLGVKKNREAYGQDAPPDYDLTQIVAPTYFYSSQNDVLCGPEDVNTLVAHMPHLTDHYHVPEPSFNHLDFIVANEMKALLNDHVIENINKHE